MDPIRMHEYLTVSRDHLFAWVRPLSREQYTTEHPIGLGSLARTLHHIKGAEWLYMQRINGRAGVIEPIANEHDPEITTAEALPFADLERLWALQSERTGADIASAVARDGWGVPTLYETTHEGKPYAYRASPCDVFTQLVLHEVHHRAQAMHMLRRLGVATGEIDYNALMYMPVEMPGG